MDSVNNVCRLCLSTNNLIWVFDRKIYPIEKMKLKDVIKTITGVEIVTEDPISQKICTECYRASILMYQFRLKANKNSKILKDQYTELLKSSCIEQEISNSDVRSEMKEKVEPEMKTKEVHEPIYEIHPSVRELLKSFPRLKLPSTWLTCNIEPRVILEKNTVENFLKKKIEKTPLYVRLSKPRNSVHKKGTSAASTATDHSKMSSLSVMIPKKKSEIDCRNKKIIQEKYTVSQVANENGDSDCESDILDNRIVNPRKRRLSGSDVCSNSDKKNPSSAKQLPKRKPVDDFADELSLEKCVPLFVCSICDSVHDNVSELKIHHLNHLRCQFCKSSFKTIDSKEAHLNGMCAIKNMMIYSPSVELEKIELDLRIRTKYPKAFIKYPLISELTSNPRSTEESEVSGNKKSGHNKKNAGVNGGGSDNDDTSLLPGDDGTDNRSIRERGIVAVRKTTQSKINRFFFPTKSTDTEIMSSTPVMPPVMPTLLSLIPTSSQKPSVELEKIELDVRIRTKNQASDGEPSVDMTSVDKQSGSRTSEEDKVVSIYNADDADGADSVPLENCISSNTSMHENEKVPVNVTQKTMNSEFPYMKSTVVEEVSSVTIPLDGPTGTPVNSVTSSTSPLISTHSSPSFIIPDIKIGPVLTKIVEKLPADIGVLKKEASSQTELPCNQSICINESCNTIEFKHAKNSLSSCKIPILLKMGEFQARYVYNSSDSKPQQPKQLCLWNNLIPIDIKLVNKPSNNEGLVQDSFGPTPTVATKNLPRPGFISDFTKTTIYPCNAPFSAGPNQGTYSRINSSLTPVNISNGSSNIHHQVVRSNYGLVNQDSFSRNQSYILVKTNVPQQQSTTNTVNFNTSSNMQVYPNSATTSYALSNCLPGPNIDGQQTSYHGGPPNVRPFGIPNLAIPGSYPAASQISINIATNVSNTQSTIYNLQNSLVTQNKAPDSVPDLMPITPGAGSVIGRIRVKSLQELM